MPIVEKNHPKQQAHSSGPLWAIRGHIGMCYYRPVVSIIVVELAGSLALSYTDIRVFNFLLYARYSYISLICTYAYMLCYFKLLCNLLFYLLICTFIMHPSQIIPNVNDNNNSMMIIIPARPALFRPAGPALFAHSFISLYLIIIVHII